jgi:nucleotide-binding universal stress UspA family protein
VKGEAPFRSILIPIDGSPEALHAARWAGELARAVHAATTLLYVHDTGEMAALGVVVWESEAIKQIEREAKDDAFEAARKVLEETGVRPERTVALVGEPADQILSYARDHGIDLIVMGYRPHSAMKTLIGGTVNERVLKSTSCPVIIAPQLTRAK